MNIKILITSVGVSALLLGIGMNVHRAWNDHDIKEASLSQFVIGQGTSGSSICKCSEQEGEVEFPNKVIMLEKYVKEVQGNGSISAALSLLSGETIGGISSGLGLGGNIIYGRRCVCKDPPSDYRGKLGCSREWEKICD